MFDDVSEHFQIMPSNVIPISYSTSLSDVSLFWGIQIIDYPYGDILSIQISNIFRDFYGEFIQDDSVLFKTLLLDQFDTLNFQIENIGTRTVDVVVMFSEDPNALSNHNSPMMVMVSLLILSEFVIILGIILVIIGVIIMIFDLKNKLENKRNY
jgi:hypothetical protein